MSDSAAKLWQNLREAFEALGRQTRLSAHYYPQGSRSFRSGVSVPGVEGEWEVGSGVSQNDAREFRRLAKDAAVAARSPEHSEGWVYWLDAIRLADRTDGQPDEVGICSMDAGSESRDLVPIIRFENICQVSAQYCTSLAIKDAKRTEDTIEGLRKENAAVLALAYEGIKLQTNRRAGGRAGAEEREQRKGRAGWRARAHAIDANLPSGLTRKDRAVQVLHALRSGSNPASLSFRTVYDVLTPRQ